LEQPKKNKMDMKLGTWNVRSVYTLGSLKTVTREVSEYKLDLVGIQVRWNKVGETFRRHW
jgi:hypothetical protein